jgi:hypothetical protein
MSEKVQGGAKSTWRLVQKFGIEATPIGFAFEPVFN